ncbi:unnamed protein product [Staurois parvus]|uniref:Transposase n=1 Tax=Staurois parvus TaxID=386267 RepID=A0ABN9H5S1_9NEOB|nr:unnamed protein product [Staurois parvus]
MTDLGQSMLKRTVRRSHQLSAESIAKDVQASCGLQITTKIVYRGLHGMGFLWPSSYIQALHCQVQCKALDAVV